MTGPELGSDPAGHRLHSGTGCQTWRVAVGRTADERLKNSREGKRVCQVNKTHDQTFADWTRRAKNDLFPFGFGPVCESCVEAVHLRNDVSHVCPQRVGAPAQFHLLPGPGVLPPKCTGATVAAYFACSSRAMITDPSSLKLNYS